MVASGAVRMQLVEFLDRLKGRYGDGLVTVGVFGSRARGEAGPDSDLDILVVAQGLPKSRLDRQIVLLSLARGVSEDFADLVAFVPLSPEEASRVQPFYLGMLSGHELLHDSGGFFGSVLDRLRRRLAELGSRRLVDEDGYEYWDLKPDWKPGDVVEL
jgi:predicted nucleotidyltransferase